MPRARVRLVNSPSGPRPLVLTDSTGVFEFTALSQGSYNLMVEKSTYLTGQIPESVGLIRARMKPLFPRDGQVTESTVLMFHDGGAISSPCSTHTATRSTLPKGHRFACCECHVGDASRVLVRHRPTTSGEYRVPRPRPGAIS